MGKSPGVLKGGDLFRRCPPPDFSPRRGLPEPRRAEPKNTMVLSKSSRSKRASCSRYSARIRRVRAFVPVRKLILRYALVGRWGTSVLATISSVVRRPTERRSAARRSVGRLFRKGGQRVSPDSAAVGAGGRRWPTRPWTQAHPGLPGSKACPCRPRPARRVRGEHCPGRAS